MEADKRTEELERLREMQERLRKSGEMFGKYIGGGLCILYILYALNIASLTFRNNTEYIKVISLFSTPQAVILLCIFLLCAYIVYKGIVNIGKFSALFMPFMVFLLLLFVVLSFPLYELTNIEPVFIEDISKITQSSFHIFCFPYGELILTLSFYQRIRKKDKKSGYKIYMTGLIVSGITLILIILNNLFVLGAPAIQKLYFPTYTAISVRNLSFVSNLEIFSTVIFFIAGIIKGSICVYAAVCGFKNLFLKNKSKTKLTLPTVIVLFSLAACIGSIFIVGSTMEMFEFLNIYIWYAPFFQLFPVIMWIIAEIKNKKAKAVY